MEDFLLGGTFFPSTERSPDLQHLRRARAIRKGMMQAEPHDHAAFDKEDLHHEHRGLRAEGIDVCVPEHGQNIVEFEKAHGKAAAANFVIGEVGSVGDVEDVFDRIPGGSDA